MVSFIVFWEVMLREVVASFIVFWEVMLRVERLWSLSLCFGRLC